MCRPDLAVSAEGWGVPVCVYAEGTKLAFDSPEMVWRQPRQTWLACMQPRPAYCLLGFVPYEVLPVCSQRTVIYWSQSTYFGQYRAYGKSECSMAAKASGFTGDSQYVHWPHAPKGCIVGHPWNGWNSTYFNTRGDLVGHPEYMAICKQGLPSMAVLRGDQTTPPCPRPHYLHAPGPPPPAPDAAPGLHNWPVTWQRRPDIFFSAREAAPGCTFYPRGVVPKGMGLNPSGSRHKAPVGDLHGQESSAWGAAEGRGGRPWADCRIAHNGIAGCMVAGLTTDSPVHG